MDLPYWATTQHWSVPVQNQLVKIEKHCKPCWPCEHRNTHSLDAVDIWQLLEKQPQLEQEQPELWAHFQPYRHFTHFQAMLIDSL